MATASGQQTLVVVPCGSAKVWVRNPGHGLAPACEAYTSGFFAGNRRYAETFGDRWVILSAKYGFIAPDFTIPGSYNVTFKRASTNPIGVEALQRQMREQQLDSFTKVICLGGADYRAVVEQAFAGTGVGLVFPFLGKDLFGMMAAAKQAVVTGSPGGGTDAVARQPAVAPLARPSQPQPTTPRGASSRVPTAAEFERELSAVLSDARAAGRLSVEVTAADLHRRVGGYPGPDHRMATCCGVMHRRRGPRDVIVHQPPSGKGPSLTIRYHLSA
jgi:hypothetical protein